MPKLDSPRIAASLGYAFLENVPTILSPWRAGGNIAHFLNSNPGAGRKPLLCQVVEGLSYLHSLEEPIVHSNIKPRNILIDDAGNAVLGDVGVQAFLESCSPAHQLQGKMEDARWTAPEVLEGHVREAASDIYSLGCVALFILKDQLPYGSEGSDVAVMKAIALGTMPIGEPQLPALHQAWRDCWARDASRRPRIEDVQLSVESW